ncbi:MAG: amidoligase family protein [Saprospiraceae bacterium]
MIKTLKSPTAVSSKKLNSIKNKVAEIVSYFTHEDPQQGARLYFEMRIGVMLSPFSNLFYAIQETAIAPKKINSQIKSYLTENPSLFLDDFFRMLQETCPDQTKELDTFSRQITHFSMLIREFTYLYGTQQDHDHEFGDYPYRTNMDNFYEKGNIIAANLLHFLATQEFANTREDFEKLADFYIRKTIFKDYKLSKNTETLREQIHRHSQKYTLVKNKIKDLAHIATAAVPLLNNLLQSNSNPYSLKQELRDYYQIAPESKHSDAGEVRQMLKKAQQRQIGFELEFNSGFNARKLEGLAKRYQALLGWKNLYTVQDKNMYDSDSDGLLFYDATLPQRRDTQGNTIGCSLEYSAPPFTFHEDGDKYTAFLNMIKAEEGAALYSNSETHQHIYAQDIDLAGMKRLVLRRAWLDQPILEAFHVPEKQKDFNRSACDLLMNISSYTTEEERIRNYIIFAGMINTAQDKPMLRQRANRGNCKYNSLNLVPGKTVEFRGMQGTFSKDFLEYYLKFNLFFVESAIQNSPVHFLPQGLRRALQLRLEDPSARLPSKSVNYHREAFDPTKHLQSDQKQQLLNADKHVIPERIKFGAKVPANPLHIGTHQAIFDIHHQLQK